MSNSHRTPTRREILRPWELIIGSLIASVFAGIIIFAGTREWQVTLVSVGIIFIVTLMGLAMFTLAIKPNAEELADLKEQNEHNTH